LSLRSIGVKVKVLDKNNNNIVKTFPTMTSANKYFGLSNNAMNRIEKKGIYNNFTFKFEEKDFRIWVYDINKKLVKIFKNKKETIEIYNMSISTLNKYILSGKLYRDKFYFYDLLNLSNLNSIKKQSEEIKKVNKSISEQTRLKISLRSIGVSVKIFDKKGSLVETFPTITSAAKYFGVSRCTISCIPNKAEFRNFIVEFWANYTRIWVYDLNKELIKVFNTPKEVSEWFNIKRQIINGYVRSGKIYKKENLYFYKNENLK